MQRFIEESRGKYASDPEVLEILTQLALKPAAYRKNSDYCNYEFFTIQLPKSSTKLN